LPTGVAATVEITSPDARVPFTARVRLVTFSCAAGPFEKMGETTAPSTTVPRKPLIPETETDEVPDDPWIIIREAEFDEREKSGGRGIMVRDTVAERETPLWVPVIVTV